MWQFMRVLGRGVTLEVDGLGATNPSLYMEHVQAARQVKTDVEKDGNVTVEEQGQVKDQMSVLCKDIAEMKHAGLDDPAIKEARKLLKDPTPENLEKLATLVEGLATRQAEALKQATVAAQPEQVVVAPTVETPPVVTPEAAPALAPQVTDALALMPDADKALGALAKYVAGPPAAKLTDDERKEVLAKLGPAIADHLPKDASYTSGKGAAQEDVRWLQRGLMLADICDGDSKIRDLGDQRNRKDFDVDGRFGDATVRSMVAFRESQGLGLGTYKETVPDLEKFLRQGQPPADGGPQTQPEVQPQTQPDVQTQPETEPQVPPAAQTQPEVQTQPPPEQPVQVPEQDGGTQVNATVPVDVPQDPAARRTAIAATLETALEGKPSLDKTFHSDIKNNAYLARQDVEGQAIKWAMENLKVDETTARAMVIGANRTFNDSAGDMRIQTSSTRLAKWMERDAGVGQTTEPPAPVKTEKQAPSQPEVPPTDLSDPAVRKATLDKALDGRPSMDLTFTTDIKDPYLGRQDLEAKAIKWTMDNLKVDQTTATAMVIGGDRTYDDASGQMRIPTSRRRLESCMERSAGVEATPPPAPKLQETNVKLSELNSQSPDEARLLVHQLPGMISPKPQPALGPMMSLRALGYQIADDPKPAIDGTVLKLTVTEENGTRRKVEIDLPSFGQLKDGDSYMYAAGKSVGPPTTL